MAMVNNTEILSGHIAPFVNGSESIDRLLKQLHEDLDWLSGWTDKRGQYVTLSCSDMLAELPVPAKKVNEYPASFAERLILAMAWAPYLRPGLLPYLHNTTRHPEGNLLAGGYMGASLHFFTPTLQTAQYLLAGKSAEDSHMPYTLLRADGNLIRNSWVDIESIQPGTPYFSRVIRPAGRLYDAIVTGQDKAPRFSAEFPAVHVETGMDWDDLVLPGETYEQVEEVVEWIEHGHKLMNHPLFARKSRRGFTALFWGPPGTGKTMTAGLIGKRTKRPVYRVDLSMVVSKYIGETEKNLSRVFEQAEHRNWILFFDEADALFGKRSETRDAHDRYANQEVSYLLQRVEEFAGTVILASNFKGNIDAAFMRRFQSVVYFPLPDQYQRTHLWRKVFGEDFTLENDGLYDELSRRFTLSGGSITNIGRNCILKAIVAETDEINTDTLREAIQKELAKEGKSMH
ncbi:MAG: ATP-binding protein [Cyclobacteriaceae bacterium]